MRLPSSFRSNQRSTTTPSPPRTFSSFSPSTFLVSELRRVIRPSCGRGSGSGAGAGHGPRHLSRRTKGASLPSSPLLLLPLSMPLALHLHLPLPLPLSMPLMTLLVHLHLHLHSPSVPLPSYSSWFLSERKVRRVAVSFLSSSYAFTFVCGEQGLSSPPCLRVDGNTPARSRGEQTGGGR